MSNSDIHLKLADINGDSTSAQHAGEIAVESWTWGVANASPAPGGGGGGVGRARFTDLSFTHRVDRASPHLWRACTTGQHIRDAVLSVARPGSGAQDYVTIKLSTVSVTSVAMTDARADAQIPLESVNLAFAKVEYSYRPQNPNGSLGAAVEFKFDLATGRVV
jgi:type VI secretion system secreted protein Hcp